MPRIAYFDCLSGISGDMSLGALIDLGADAAQIESAVRSLGLPELAIKTAEVKKCGFRAVQVTIDHPPEHAHRHLHHIEEMIERADAVSPRAKELARDIFRRLGEAEAKVHGTTLEKVHFHEVGAIDSIADIVGFAVALDALGIQTVRASAVPTGTGTVQIAHGRVAIPAPATAELLRGIPIAASDIEAELTTPTGAAILKATSGQFGAVPAMTIEAVGYGAGSRDLDRQANVLRVLLGEIDEPAASLEPVESDRVVVLETNLDDATPQQVADCAERLLAAGALDVFQTACTMKKGRLGVVLSVLSPPSRVSSLERLIYQHTTSIGIRRWSADRHKLPRQAVTIETPLGPVRGKQVTLPGGEQRLTIEDDEAKSLATATGKTTAEVRRVASEAWTQRRARGADRH